MHIDYYTRKVLRYRKRWQEYNKPIYVLHNIARFTGIVLLLACVAHKKVDAVATYSRLVECQQMSTLRHHLLVNGVLEAVGKLPALRFLRHPRLNRGWVGVQLSVGLL